MVAFGGERHRLDLLKTKLEEISTARLSGARPRLWSVADVDDGDEMATVAQLNSEDAGEKISGQLAMRGNTKQPFNSFQMHEDDMGLCYPRYRYYSITVDNWGFFENG